jgi:mRNA interferase RelE/StbE
VNFTWPESARSELRAVDRENAMRILLALTRYAESGEGDIKALSGERDGYCRLRVGDFPVTFRIVPEDIVIVRIRHRSDVYRSSRLTVKVDYSRDARLSGRIGYHHQGRTAPPDG